MLFNYQYLQTLDMTDDEIDLLTAKTKEKIQNIATSPDDMLKTLRADEEAESPFLRALSLYPELLRESYAKNTLKSIKKRMVLDAK